MRKYTLGMCAMLFALMLGPPSSSWAGTVSMTFDGASSYLGSYYVAPYQVTVGNTVYNLVCDDANDNVYVGEQWTATTETVSSLSGVLFTKGYLDNSSTTISSTQAYEEAAWLVNQIYANQGTTAAGEYQYALWDIFAPGFSNSSGTWKNGEPGADLTSAEQTAVNADLKAAEQNYGAGNYSNLVIYTPYPKQAGQAQEFFGVMPEPMTLWSLLMTLAAIALACRWLDKTNVKPRASAKAIDHSPFPIVNLTT